MPREFLHYWRPDTVDHESKNNDRLTHIASNQLSPSRVRRGDVIWIVTVRDGELFLVSRVVVGRVIEGQQEAEQHFGTSDLWEAAYHIEPMPGAEAFLHEVSISDIAASLRFQSTTTADLTLQNGRVNPQQLQSMRRLTDDSADLLQQRWERSGQ
jgi:hypothetical protein